MNKKEIINEIENKFREFKDKRKMKIGFEELNREFYIEDRIVIEGFVSDKYFPRQLSHKISEAFRSWIDYSYAIIMPNVNNMISMGQSKIFSKEEKEEIIKLIKKAMEVMTRDSLISLTKGEDEEARFIEYAYSLWMNEFKEKLIKIMKKINTEWGNEK